MATAGWLDLAKALTLGGYFVNISLSDRQPPFNSFDFLANTHKGCVMSCLFEPIMLAKVKIKNRFVHSATNEAMAADDGSITDDIVGRYTRLAKGDVGLIIPGHLYVHPLGKPITSKAAFTLTP